MSDDKNEKAEEVKMVKVYKSNGKSLEVNPGMVKYLDELGLSKTKPK